MGTDDLAEIGRLSYALRTRGSFRLARCVRFFIRLERRRRALRADPHAGIIRVAGLALLCRVPMRVLRVIAAKHNPPD